MIGPTNKEFDFLFNVIYEENYIEDSEFLKKCIHNVIASADNRYLSYVLHEFELAQYDIESQEYTPELYDYLNECEKEYLDALEYDLNDKKDIVLDSYFDIK